MPNHTPLTSTRPATSPTISILFSVGIRVEHCNNGEKQGAAAGRSMLGSSTPYDYVHSFWSDQYQHKIKIVGHATAWDDLVVRGSIEGGRLVGLYLSGGVLRAAVGVDRGGDPEVDRDSRDGGLRSARRPASQARPRHAR